MILNMILLNLVKPGLGSLKIMTNYICEGSNMYINCSSSEKLSILRANYGRLSISMCNSQGTGYFAYQLKFFFINCVKTNDVKLGSYCCYVSCIQKLQKRITMNITKT